MDGELVFSQEEADDNATLWENMVVGYVIGFKPHIPMLEEHLKPLSSPKGFIEALARGHRCFILRFSDPEDMKVVLEGGLWKRWEQGEPLE